MTFSMKRNLQFEQMYFVGYQVIFTSRFYFNTE